MELISQLQRLRYVYGWRLRYWYLDTQGGRAAQVASCVFSALVVVVQVARISVAVAAPSGAAPREAFYWWVVQLIVMIVAAAVSYATRPKTTKPTAQTAEAPSTEDGQAVKHYFGTCWVDDQFILAWKQMGTVPVKTKSGKK